MMGESEDRRRWRKKKGALELPGESVSEADRAYTAGIIDGEGTICLAFTRQNKARNICLTPIVACGTTDEFIAPFLQRTWGGGMNLFQSTKKPHLKPVLRWYLHGHDRIAAFLSAIRPYLKVKAGRADALIAFCESRQRTMWPNGRMASKLKRGYTADEIRIAKTLTASPYLQ